jgi:hypothetical protein
MIIPSQHASRVARAAAGGGGGGSDFTANEFNFNNVFLNPGENGTTNTVTMPHAGTLAMTISGAINGNGYIYKNGVAQTAYTTSALSTTGIWANDGFYALFAVANADQVYFYYETNFGSGPAFVTVNVRNATFAGTIIDQHTVENSGEG